MQTDIINICAISNDSDFKQLLRSCLAGMPDWQISFQCYSISDPDIAKLKCQNPDVILIDHQLKPYTGLEILTGIRKAGIKKPIIMLAEKGDERMIVEIMKAGADDYINKSNLNAETLTQSIIRELEQHKTKTFHAHTRQIERHLAYHDYLTNLPNRKLFFDRLHQAISQGYRNELCVAILFVDLDGFKAINDTYGHSRGDFILKRMAERLRDCVRESDTIARFGGDEFVVILNSVAGAGDAARVAEKILPAISAELKLHDQLIKMSASIGISIFPSDGNQIDALLKNADLAMYKAKQYKNNYKFYHSFTNEKIEAQLNSERILDRAIKQNEFTLFYQPVIDTSSREIKSLEALIRWRHPKAGIVLPGAFLPIAESNGLIFRLGEWVIQEVMLQSECWRKDGHQIKISMNISNRQIQEEDFSSILNRITNEIGANPENIAVEITESCITKYDDKTSINFKKLGDSGFDVSVDNFGTSFPSLSFLNSIPVNSLKIDKSLINTISAKNHSNTFVKAIIDMAHDLRFNVIAKGVETTEQNQALRLLQCDQQQGYLFSPAVSSNEAQLLLERKTFPATLSYNRLVL